MSKRVVAVFTGNRAEYGLQYPILKAIDAHKDLDYRLMVSGAHLDNDFGRTLDEIKADGFEIHDEVKIDVGDDTLYATAQAIGSGVLSISQSLSKIRPDLFVVYADRFEGFAAMIAGTQMNIPTAHIEGGDITEGGALDDSVRHAMTKLAHLHFTTNQQASNRVLAMGEEPWRVHTVGFPAIDMIQEGNYAKWEELQEGYNLDMERPIVLFTQHSVTTEYTESAGQITPSLKALERLANEGVQVILTYPNNDAGGRAIIEELINYQKLNIENTQVHDSLGRFNYHGILSLARDTDMRIACVGNSSSGIKETPAFGCPTVDIGSRQKGRLRGVNVVQAEYDEKDIYNKITSCLYDENFKNLCSNCDNPYGVGDAGIKVAEILADVTLNKELIQKRMTLKGEANEGWYR